MSDLRTKTFDHLVITKMFNTQLRNVEGGLDVPTLIKKELDPKTFTRRPDVQLPTSHWAGQEIIWNLVDKSPFADSPSLALSVNAVVYSLRQNTRTNAITGEQGTPVKEVAIAGGHLSGRGNALVLCDHDSMEQWSNVISGLVPEASIHLDIHSIDDSRRSTYVLLPYNSENFDRDNDVVRHVREELWGFFNLKICDETARPIDVERLRVASIALGDIIPQSLSVCLDSTL